MTTKPNATEDVGRRFVANCYRCHGKPQRYCPSTNDDYSVTRIPCNGYSPPAATEDVGREPCPNGCGPLVDVSKRLFPLECEVCGELKWRNREEPRTQPTDSQAGEGLYRKRPITVSAARWFKNGDHPDDGDPATEGEVVRYYRNPGMDGARLCGLCDSPFHEHGWIDTLEGGHVVCLGDWIIRGVKGERYPCKPDVFAATYEPAQPPTGHPTEHLERAQRVCHELGITPDKFREHAIAQAIADAVGEERERVDRHADRCLKCGDCTELPAVLRGDPNAQ